MQLPFAAFQQKKLFCDAINRFGTSTYEIRNDFFCSVTNLVDNSKFLAWLSLHSQKLLPKSINACGFTELDSACYP